MLSNFHKRERGELVWIRIEDRIYIILQIKGYNLQGTSDWTDSSSLVVSTLTDPVISSIVFLRGCMDFDDE